MIPAEIIAAFDGYLHERGLRFESVIIGGAALSLLGLVRRQTRDCDVIHPGLPQGIREAARAFAHAQRAAGVTLGDEWLNDEPSSLAALLPSRWEARLREVFRGRAVVLKTLGRPDLLKTKLFAYVDRGTDLGDCVALEPTADELREALPWVQAQDAHPRWPTHAQESLRALGEKLGHGV